MASSVRQAVYAVGAGGQAQARFDELAAEEPLEIRVLADWQEEDAGGGVASCRREERTLALTLRTPAVASAEPSPDCELALGYLFGEGLIAAPDEVEELTTIEEHVLRVRLAPGRPLPWRSLDRQGLSHSACGLCGRRSLEALLARTPPPIVTAAAVSQEPIAPALIAGLPQALQAAQAVFARTGGLHAAALFDRQGQLRLLREDIGRHNAVDKLIGAALLRPPPPAPALSEQILVVSGRAGFELVQKAYRAGLTLFVAVGAPSSLAVRLAQQVQLSLIGFCRDGRFTVYSGPERIGLAASGG